MPTRTNFIVERTVDLVLLGTENGGEEVRHLACSSRLSMAGFALGVVFLGGSEGSNIVIVVGVGECKLPCRDLEIPLDFCR